MSIHVRRIQADDWALARQLRLSALSDAPEAFAATLAEERAMPDALWQARASGNAEGIATAGFFAVRDGHECGLTVGVWHAGEVPFVELNAMWVAPHARREGAGRALIEAVVAWARERGVGQVELDVVENGAAAIALYRSAGFELASMPARRCGANEAPALRMIKPLTEFP